MADHAKVTSLDSLDSFRAAMVIFLTKGRVAVDQASDEVKRARQWVEHDRRAHWENELKRRTRNLERAQQELLSARYSEFNDSQTMQKSAVRKAKALVEEAEDKLRRVKAWTRNFDGSFEPLTRKLDVLRQYLENDLPRAIAYLVQVQRTLEAYAETSPLLAAAPPAADLPEPAAEEPPPAAAAPSS